MPFASLGLSPDLVRATAERQYLAPTPIQTAAIPAILRGEDVLGSAQTGSGKTAAFALPLLQKIAERGRQTPRELQTLVLVPTRELAAQIAESMARYAKALPEPVKIVPVFGGVSINPQMMALRGGAEVVIATPGRLLDLLRSNALRIFGISTLVLDEADRLLDLGFAEELERILALLPRRRQNLFFSATFPPAVQALAQTLLHQPTRIEVAATPQTAPVIHQRAIEVDAGRRTQLLRHLVQEGGTSRVLVFVATQYATEHVAEKLSRAGIQAAPFHGDLSQGARTRVLEDFKASTLQVVIATDVAARGIDIAHLPMVVNYDLPRSADDYLHRIGRTGRAGRSGTAISFVSAETEAHFRLIEKRQQQRVPRERIAGFEPAETEATANAPDPTGGIKGKRKSKKDKLREAAALAAAPGTRK
ncbi:MAG TPA: DEAD/DEAH box helicase [Ideonella sp.]|nr:DEAD/DEAH box helicase [Ideonella sp.]